MRTSHKRRKIEKSSVVASISLLEGLPRELVWKIIELVPDTVLTLRSVNDVFYLFNCNKVNVITLFKLLRSTDISFIISKSFAKNCNSGLIDA